MVKLHLQVRHTRHRIWTINQCAELRHDGTQGAFDFAESESRRLIARAYAVIDGIPLDTEGKEVFRAISRFMIDRNT